MTTRGKVSHEGWGVLWRDKEQQHLLGGVNQIRPDAFMGYRTMVFRTKRECQGWIKIQYGYIAKRQDLRHPPYNWLMPLAVKVEVSVSRPRAVRGR